MKFPRPLGINADDGHEDLLKDFGGFHRGESNHQWERPSTIEEVVALIHGAYTSGTPVRFRGHGHSMNGSSLPREREVLLTTENLCGFAFEEENTISVGAGALIWDLHRLLADYHYQLLISNDGAAPAPTIGGFVAAGGIGENTSLFGGFWETVRELTVVTGTGEMLTCRPGDELFQWMFGSMGQLAFVVQAKLAILPKDQEKYPYPEGSSGTVPRTKACWDRYSWFTLFVPFAMAEKAMQQLGELCGRHADCWRPLANYVYPVRFHNFNPMLLYPRQNGFVALGIWGTPVDGHCFDFAAMRALEREFMALTFSQPEYRRYIQTEMTFDVAGYRQYFGEAIFERFLQLKLHFDPALILNRGNVF